MLSERGTAGDPALGEVDDAYTTNATTRKTKRTAGTHMHMFTCFTSSKVPVLTPEGTRSYRSTISRSSNEEASRKFKVRKQVCWPMRRIERGR